MVLFRVTTSTARHKIRTLDSYGDQVATSIKTLAPRYADNTLTDVPYQGQIVPRKVEILPSSLPYDVNAFVNWSNTGTPEAAVLPDGHRYFLNVTVKNAASTVLLTQTAIKLPQRALERVTLSFQGSTAGDQTALSTWQNDGNLSSALPCTVNVVPVLKLEGTTQTLGGTAVGLCTTDNKLDLSVTLTESRTSATVNTVSYSNIGGANYHALQGYAFQTSDRLLGERVAKLVAAVKANANPNSNQEATEGEFLHITGLKYMRYLSDANKQVGALDGGSGDSGNHLGLVSSAMKVQYLFDLPFAVYRQGFLVDVPGGSSRNVDLATGTPLWKTFSLSGYSASAYESYIWQEGARLDAVSTVRGIQFANEKGIQVLTLTAANWAAESPKFTSNADATLNLYASQVTSIKTSYIDQGYTVTVPRSLIRYNNTAASCTGQCWVGAVFVAEKNDTVAGTMNAGYIISGGYAGGFTLGSPQPLNFYDIALNSGFVTPNPGATYPSNGATNVNGLTQFVTLSGDPVNMVNGNMYHVERDVVIKGRGGLPFVFERSYNSRNPKDGPLGFGWTHSFNHALKFNDDNMNGAVDAGDTDGITASVSWFDGTGTERAFPVTGNAGGVPISATFTNPEGVYVTVTRPSTYSIKEKNGLTYTFENVAGTVGQSAKLLSITDRNTNTLTLAYSGSNLTSVTDGLSRALTFTYTGNRINTLSDWSGRTSQYTYDANGDLWKASNPLAYSGAQSPVTYTYYTAADGTNLNHAMKRYQLPRGNGMSFEYYTHGKTFRHYDDLGNTNTFSYNEFRRETKQVNERGFTRQFFFDQYGNPLKIVEENGAVHTYTYDAVRYMNRLSKTDAMGQTTSYAYDSSANVTQITLPSGNTQTLGYFSFGQPGKIKDARGNYTLLKFDAKGNVLQSLALKSGIGAALDPTTYTPLATDLIAWNINTYGTYGNLTVAKAVRNFTTQVGPTLEYAYDASNLNVTTITRKGDKNGDGTIAASEYDSATLTYDTLGRLKTGINADWYPVSTDYDTLDRVTRSTDAVGQQRDYIYDPNGNLTEVRLETLVNGVLTRVDSRSAQFDLADRRIAATDAGGYVTQLQYDAAGNAISVTNPDNYSIGIGYDAANRAVVAYDAEAHNVSTVLDAGGRSRNVVDPNGNGQSFEYYDATRDGRLKYAYDALNHKTTLDYDPNGNRTSTMDNLNRTSYITYDELNRPTRVVGALYTDATYGSVRPISKYTYDTLGNVSQIQAGRTDASGTNAASDVVTTQQTNQYDDFGRLLKKTDALSRVWAYTYDVYGNVLTRLDPKNQTTTYTWDTGHLLKTRTDQTNRITTYTYNVLGQVTKAQGPDVAYDSTEWTTAKADPPNTFMTPSADSPASGRRIGTTPATPMTPVAAPPKNGTPTASTANTNTTPITPSLS